MATRAERSELATLLSKCLAFADCGRLDDAYDYAGELEHRLDCILTGNDVTSRPGASALNGRVGHDTYR